MLMLMLMIVIGSDSICPFILPQELRASRKSLQHSHEHVNDAHELLFRGHNSLCGNEPSDCEHVKACSALQGRTTSDF